MPVEPLGTAAIRDGSKTPPRPGAALGRAHTLRRARLHEGHGRNRVRCAHRAGSPDPAPAAAPVASRFDGLRIVLAQAPDVSCPAFAGQVSRGAQTRGAVQR